MQITFINVGYGDSILLEMNNGNDRVVILVDGGKLEEEHYKGNLKAHFESMDG